MKDPMNGIAIHAFPGTRWDGDDVYLDGWCDLVVRGTSVRLSVAQMEALSSQLRLDAEKVRLQTVNEKLGDGVLKGRVVCLTPSEFKLVAHLFTDVPQTLPGHWVRWYVVDPRTGEVKLNQGSVEELHARETPVKLPAGSWSGLA